MSWDDEVGAGAEQPRTAAQARSGWREPGTGGPADPPPAGVSVEQWARALALQIAARAGVGQVTATYSSPDWLISAANQFASFILNGVPR